MKKKQATLYSFLLAMLFISCEKDIKRYDGETNIYFVRAVDQLNSAAPVYDSLTVTFAFHPSKTDSLVKIPVRITGVPSTEDREYEVAVDATSTAIAGVHYEALPETLTLKAGKVADTIPVKLFRTADMLTSDFSLILELQPNGNFKTNMVNKVVNATSGQMLSFTRLKIFVNDILNKPKYWLDAYMGTFSRKKLLLTSELLDIPVDALNSTTTSISQQIFYANYMQRYLNDKKAAGETIYEEDGSEMVMGPSVQ